MQEWQSLERRPSAAEREDASSTLSSAYAEGRIDLPELERRQALLIRAATWSEALPAFDGLARPAALDPAARFKKALPPLAEKGASVAAKVLASAAIFGVLVVLTVAMSFGPNWGAWDAVMSGGSVVAGAVLAVRKRRRARRRLWWPIAILIGLAALLAVSFITHLAWSLLGHVALR